ncbi:hypothetical protein [Alcaligenes sp. SDU_A2]|uniref:hypothetical protein n=1 Tax=Alcaligenes sp. SDU_A2 TaxID=3136634 RepID=UPI00311F0A8E
MSSETMDQWAIHMGQVQGQHHMLDPASQQVVPPRMFERMRLYAMVCRHWRSSSMLCRCSKRKIDAMMVWGGKD